MDKTSGAVQKSYVLVEERSPVAHGMCEAIVDRK